MGLLKNTFRTLILAAVASAPFVATADQPYHPFAEPLTQDPDWQFFSPVDIQELEDLSARQQANYGWYLTYDRLHAGLDRPIIEPERNKFDTTWGNRWTFGVMDDCDRGWDFQFLHFSGPNAYHVTRGPRLLSPAIDPEELNLRLPLPGERYPYDPGFGFGVVEIQDSLNVATLGSFEINRTWRTEPYMYGGFLEPMVGLRYIDFTDYNIADGFSLFEDVEDNRYERFDVSNIITKNRMLVGQVGFRYFKDISRFRFSTEFKAFGGGNWQTGSVLTQSFVYGEPEVDGPSLIGRPLSTLTVAPGLKDKAVPGMDVKVDASWKATKQISLRAGAGLLYIGQGIARGSQIPGPGNFIDFSNPPIFGPSASFVQQNMVMPSVNMGITLNR